MGEVNIGSAVEKLEADSQRVRNEGLEELKHILGQSRGTSRLDSLHDDGFHKIFEALFRIVRAEKPTYLRASKPIPKSASASRLSTAAAVIRLTVEVGCAKIKHKTANAILDHITETLPTNDQGFCPPLRIDYMKSFRTILEFAPHTEHLRTKQWQTFVDFILDGIGSESGDYESNGSATPARDRSVDSRNGPQVSVRISQASVGRMSRGDMANSVDDLISCLKLLTGVPNAPLVSRAADIVQTMVECLASTGRSQEAAFETLNNVLLLTLTENVALARKAVGEVIPVIRRLWSTKSAALRDQILTTLALSEGLFLEAAKGSSRIGISQMSDLLTTLMQEYFRRSDRDMLQLDDIVIFENPASTLLHARTVAPFLGSPRAITNWVTLSVMASLIVALDGAGDQSRNVSPSDGRARKRPKLSSPVDDLIHQAIAALGQDRLCAIQLLLFVLNRSTAVAERILGDVLQLADGILDEDGTIVSWIQIVLAELAYVSVNVGGQPTKIWEQAWHSAARTLSGSATCRTGCHLLNSILRTNLLNQIIDSDSLDSALFGNGFNGPCALSDAALQLWTAVMSHEAVSTAKNFQTFSAKCIRWLDAYWTFPIVLDRLHNSQITFYTQTGSLRRLLMANLNEKTSVLSVGTTIITSSIYRFLLRLADSLPVNRFLLNLESHPNSEPRVSRDRIVKLGLDAAEYVRQQHLVLELLASKMNKFRQAWDALETERSSNISNDVLHISATVCATTYAITSAIQTSHRQKSEIVSGLIEEFWEKICTFIMKQDADTRQRSLTTVANAVLRLEMTMSLTDTTVDRELLTTPILSLLKEELNSQRSGAISESDMMELEDSFLSQASQVHLDVAAAEGLRQYLPIINDLRSATGNLTACLVIDNASSGQPDKVDSEATSRVVDFVLSLDSSSLLAARIPLTSFFEKLPSITRLDACRMLKKLAESCLQHDDYERCESSLRFCLDILTSFARLWTSGDDDLTAVASDIYAWYLNVAMGKGIASPKVMFGIATMLGAVMTADPLFGADASLPSPRTSLLRILKVGNNSLRYHLSHQTSRIFEQFILTEHEAIFNDVLESLPSDPEEIEGIAVRLFMLAELASTWHTVLRTAIYHLFETPAHIPASSDSAQRCLWRVCRALKLASPKTLLVLFGPQIIYTWLENETIDSMPFKIFGYANLQDLLRDVEDELVGQIAMRASDALAKSVSRLLETPWQDLLSVSFVKAEAYAVSKDINVPRETETAKSSESSIRKQLGADAYLDLVRSNFPEMTASLFVTLGDLQGVDRALARHPYLEDAKDILGSICSRSQSTMVLPAAQQPSFRAKYFPDVLQFLCQRIDQNPAELWTPAMLTYLYRKLLDEANPALGPLHACAVLRKIRLLVCLAGPSALEGYPLEMLLHNLRPYLTNFHCSEDALGVFWYLIEHSEEYLKSHLSFLIGLSVATFAALSRFTESSQDSTTQESQFRSTMNKVSEFHDWLGRYLMAFKAPAVDREILKCFNRLSKLAASVTKSGSNVKGSAEGDLVFAMLEDQASQQPLLTDSAFRLAIEILCSKFELVADLMDDILGDHKDCSRHAAILACLIDQLSLPENFKIWVAQVLGRSYASKGLIDWNLDRKVQIGESASITESYSMILHLLEDFARRDDPRIAGLAEKTLQIISSALRPQDRLAIRGPKDDGSLLKDLAFSNFLCPRIKDEAVQSLEQSVLEHWTNDLSVEDWASRLARELCAQCSTDAVLAGLPVGLAHLPSFATQTLPAIVHIVLSSEDGQQSPLRQQLSSTFREGLNDAKGDISGQLRIIVNILLHLRRMPLPREATMAERNTWLEVDLGKAAVSALRCGMSTAALLFLELKVSQQSLQSSRASRRSSISSIDELTEIMPTIFQTVDDLDFFYSVQESPTLASLVKKLTHEKSDLKTLSFQSAIYDSSLKSAINDSASVSESAVFSALSSANFDGLAKAVRSRIGSVSGDGVSRSTLEVSLNLHQWDLPPQANDSDAARVMLEVFQATNTAPSKAVVNRSLDQALSRIVKSIPIVKLESSRGQETLSAMSLLTEMREVLQVTSFADLEEICQRFESQDWVANESFEKLSPILLGREALFSTIKTNDRLRSVVNISPLEAQLLEIRSIKNSLRVARNYEAAQFCLNRVVHLSRLSEIATKQGLNVDAIAQHQLASVLWDQGEAAASIQMLRSLRAREDLALQSISISSAEILADLGHEIAEARLDKPDEIIRSYLLPAIKELNGRTDGAEAGRVFHNFAAFCDMQLQNVDDLDDYNRIERIRFRKEKEVQDLERMVSKAADAKQREHLKKLYLDKAKTWFKLDDEEYRRLKANREKFVQQCLENYLLSLKACDIYGNDVLRFVALWMNQSESQSANAAVSKHLSEVPSRKFAPLMNQLSSRILDQKNDFQQLLFELLFRICCDHPYHSLYQVFATSKSKGAKADEIATSRFTAAAKLANHVMKNGPSGSLWVAIHNSSIAFVRLANERLPDKKLKSGSKVALRELSSGSKLEQTIHDSHTKTPPPTMKIELRADRDYTSVPTYSKFDPQFSIAGGVSAPKIVTITASNGFRYKILLKGGNDDLRQDSIMEQVFEQVSNLLKDHRATRQRNLGIRTYKVIPLTPNAGIIEFVKDTIPLHEYLLPAHQRYFPKDYKPNRCRKEIADAQTKSLPQRLQAYRTVCANFHPVMRFFFMEHFLDPDEWFQKRLNYSRSTAAISILGHVLGLGDRHGHNILLDEQTGEVVHIDLGVAFEAGRVLPVPEVVPFRLTRDLVDGMGLSGVEGVFRRCCNFTLEALRLDQYSIMTILDVLRYDPLYSWSVSPLRLQRMQEEQENAAAAAAASTAGQSFVAGRSVTSSVASTSFVGPAGAQDVNEPSEADRVLTVVAKKLGKSLSAEATVNELIQQATDEKNLASLYCGWAAYA